MNVLPLPHGKLLVGDNLASMVSLKDMEARFDMVYVDPPYNTGHDSGWTYNDKRLHDDWMSFMRDRFMAVRDVMHPHASIACSINDSYLPHIRILMSEVFGEDNRLGTFIYVNSGNVNNHDPIKCNHEYVVVYAKDKSRFTIGNAVDPNTPDNSKLKNPCIVNSIVKNGPRNPISDIVLPKGFPTNFESGTIQSPKSDSYFPIFTSQIQVQDYKTLNEVVLSSGWSSKKLIQSFIDGGFNDILDSKGRKTRFFLSNTGTPHIEKDRGESINHVKTVLTGMGTTREVSSTLAEKGIKFTYPKPVKLITYLIEALCANKSGNVLDMFSGSGTVGESVDELNARGYGLSYVLLEEDDTTAQSVILPRLKT